MSDKEKTKEQLIEELQRLRQRVVELEASEAERKRTEEALQESEKNFRALADNANDGIMIAAGKGAHIYANRRMAEITGYSVTELLKTTMADLVHPDQLKEVRERFQRRLEGKPAPRQYEIVFVRKDGKSVPLEMTSAKTVWRGQPATIVVFRDITRRKQAELALERRALQLQTAAEVSRAASSILDPDELIQRVVNLVRKRFDLYYAGLFLVDDSGKWAVLRAGTGEAGQKMVDQGHKLEVGGESMIGWCVANQQARIALDVGKEAVRFANPLLPETRSELALPLISRGRAIGALTIQSVQEAAFSEEDIAVLQTMADQLANAIANARLYDALAREQYLMTTLMDNISDYIYFKDRESRFIRTTKAHAKTFGLSDPVEAIGKTDFDFFSDEHARQAYEDEQEIVRTGQPLLDIEERETWPDRPDTWVLTSKMPLCDEAGNVVGTFGISRDITERKRAELALERRALQLQTAAEVSRAASSILDPDELIQQVVNLVRKRFDLYYAGLFLVDDSGKWAVLRAGTGEAGQKMVDQGHKLEVGGESMIGWCVANQQARIALDVGKEAVRFANPLLPETRSEMALPLISRGRVIGAMTIQSTQSAAFSEEDITVLQTMADQVANAIENARLFEEALARTREVAALAETGRKLTSTLELDAVLDFIIDACLEFFQVQQACFIMMDKDGYLRMRRHRGLSEEFARSIVGRPGEGFFGKVYQSGEAILVRDARKQLDPTTAEAVLREGVTSFVHVPVKVKGETVAVMNLTSSREDRRFSERDLERLSAFADQAAIAIENARLFEETQVTLAEIAALYQAGRGITAAETVDDILQPVLDYIVLPHLDRVLIALFDPNASPEEPVVVVPAVWDRDRSLMEALRGQRVKVSEIPMIATLDPNTTMVINNVDTDEWLDKATRFFFQSFDVKSVVTLPLTAAGDHLGWMFIETTRDYYTFTEEELRPYRAIVGQVAVAIANAQAFEREQRRADQLRVVNEVGRTLTSILDVDTLLGQVVQLIRDAFDYYQVNLGLIEGNALVPKAWAGSLSAFPAGAARLSLDAEAIVTQAAASGAPLLVPDVRREPSYLPLPGLEKVRSELVVPLKSKDQIIGVLDVESDRLAAFDERDLTVLEALAGQIAVAIENARLFEQRQQASFLTGLRVKELDCLNDIGRKIEETPSVPEFLQWVAERIPLAMQHQVVCVAAIEFEGQVYGAAEAMGLPCQIVGGLRVGGKVVGRVYISYTEEHDFLDEESALLGDIVRRVNGYIESRRLFEQTQERIQALRALHRAVQSISAELDPDVLTGRLVYEACRLIEADYGVLVTLDPATGGISHFKTSGIELGRCTLTQLPQGQGLLKLMLEGQTVRVDDIRQHPSYSGDLPAGHLPIVSFLGLPLLYQDQVRGFLAVSNQATGSTFDQADEDLLGTFAAQAAVTLENARLFQEAQVRADRERVIREISDQMQRATDMDALMQITAEELNKALGGSRAYVCLGTE
jgi:PAS domain S-box-containing protein